MANKFDLIWFEWDETRALIAFRLTSTSWQLINRWRLCWHQMYRRRRTWRSSVSWVPASSSRGRRRPSSATTRYSRTTSTQTDCFSRPSAATIAPKRCSRSSTPQRLFCFRRRLRFETFRNRSGAVFANVACLFDTNKGPGARPHFFTVRAMLALQALY